jgi:uncharacterized protein
MNKKVNYDYFGSFIDYAACALRAARFLKDTMGHFDPETFPQRQDEMHVIEHEADQINHRTVDQLAREFLPPIEPEDIAAISREFDDVVDALDDIMRLMGMFNVRKLRPEIAEFCDLAVDCALALGELVEEFRHFKKSGKIQEKLIRINTLESQGDSLHYRAVQQLFIENGGALETMIWKEIFDDFEGYYDECEDVGDVIKNVVLKNS